MIVERALPYTMTGVARLTALVDAVRYCVRSDVPGSIAECGVWKGGSILAALLTLQQMGIEDRDVYLYDTFDGMTEPTEHDVSRYDEPALKEWERVRKVGDRLYSGLFDDPTVSIGSVGDLVGSVGYPAERLHLVQGPVEETLPSHSPGGLAILRLDTDWYESTLHELTHLYPLLADRGVLIIDDYGHWDGCRKAVEEYFPPEEAPLLTRIDYAARIAIKST